MDVDAFAQAHARTWTRLEDLCSRRRLTVAEADEFVDLYQRAATHLSLVRSSTPDPYLVPYLSWLVTRARARAYTGGQRIHPVAAFVRFFTRSFPAALYRMRRWWGSVLVLSLVWWAVMWAWFAAHPDQLYSAANEEWARRYVDRDFVEYYSEYHPFSFFLKVFTHNAWLSIQLVALGILGLPVLFILHANLAGVASAGALHGHYDKVGQFFGYIAPHGILELTGLFVAAGLGLRLFWSWISPGDRSRAASLAEAGRTSIGAAVGLVVVFLVAGTVEGFVTPSGWPTPVRIGIGVLVEVLFLAYVFVVGRRAAREGVTGDVQGADVVAELPARS